VREPHAFCVKLTLAGVLSLWISLTKRFGTVRVKGGGLIMKPRGMISTFPPSSLRLIGFYFFLPRTGFFSFHLTGVEVFYNHHRPPVG